MDSIFHEKQEGSLCGQHCLNALLQGEYFTAVDLATLAQQMDDEERSRMSEAGLESQEYRNFLQAGSQNMDDSGYFSVQVISAALRVWGLDLVPFNSSDPRAAQARTNPAVQKAYICNYRDHWFTVRRLGRQWFNLNSLLTGPELVSNSYLSEFLAQLQQEGYSIFVVSGVLPDCAADQLLQTVTVSQPVKPRLISEQKTIDSLAGDDDDLRAAIAASLDPSVGGAGPTVRGEQSDSVDQQLRAVLRASLGGGGGGPEEQQLQAALEASLRESEGQPGLEEDEEAQLQRAIRLSMEGTPGGSDVIQRPVAPEAVRAQREAFLQRIQGTGQQPNT